jgi:small subunit ribosomal protein S2
MRDRGEFELWTKKEALGMTREIERLESRLGGIRDMDGLPDLLFVVDVSREEIPVHEANLLKIPVVAMVDTNCNPKNIDYVIPANDDAIRGIQLIVSKIAQAVNEGINMRKDKEAMMDAAEAEAQLPEELRDELSDEDLLGESTLAKMKEEESAEAKRNAADEEKEKAQDEEAEAEDEETPEDQETEETEETEESEASSEDDADEDEEEEEENEKENED